MKWYNAGDERIADQSCVLSQVDILNTDYANLPERWQADNKAAATVVVDIFERVGSVNLDDPEQYQLVGDIVHNEWAKRNDWQVSEVIMGDDGNPKINKKTGEPAKYGDPFSELPDDEQEKDIAQIRTAMDLGLDR